MRRENLPLHWLCYDQERLLTMHPGQAGRTQVSDQARTAVLLVLLPRASG